MTKSADVVIVGGGIVGCALARELAGRGAAVTVVERGQPGCEASGAAAGLLAPQAEGLPAGPLFDLALESRRLYPKWTEDLALETGIDAGYRLSGILRCFFSGMAEQWDSYARSSTRPARGRRSTGLYLATGHYRNGILLAPVTALALAEEIAGASSRDLAPFSIERFSRRRVAAPRLESG